MNETIFKTLFAENTIARADDIRAARKAYFIAKAAEDTIKSISEDIKREILAEGNYIVCDEIWNIENHRGLKNRRITEPKHTYLMDEEIFINDFLEKCYVEYQKAGIADSRGKEYNPESVAFEARVEAENLLLKLAIDIIPDDMMEKSTLERATKHWKYREQILDLILRLDI